MSRSQDERNFRHEYTTTKSKLALTRKVEKLINRVVAETEKRGEYIAIMFEPGPSGGIASIVLSNAGICQVHLHGSPYGHRWPDGAVF